jgi:hypothetical protein
MQGWLSLRSDLTSLSAMHSSHEYNFRFIFLMATWGGAGQSGQGMGSGW